MVLSVPAILRPLREALGKAKRRSAAAREAVRRGRLERLFRCAAAGHPRCVKKELRALGFEEDAACRALSLSGCPSVTRAVAKARPDVFANISPLALLDATEGGNTVAVAALLDAGVNASVPCCVTGDTPLHVAVTSNSVSCLHVLLKHGADVNAMDSQGETPLHRSATLGHIECLKKLLEDKRTQLNACYPPYLKTPLHCAAAAGHTPCVQILMQAGMDPSAQDHMGATPLHRAASGSGTVEVMNLLLESGAVIDAKDHKWQCPLHYAVLADSAANVSWLIGRGAHADARARNGCTALHIAAARSRIECMEELVAGGACVDAADKRGFTPMHKAAWQGYLGVLYTLLNLGARVNVVAQYGITPLMICVAREDEDFAYAIIEAGADVHAATDEGFQFIQFALKEIEKHVNQNY